MKKILLLVVMFSMIAGITFADSTTSTTTNTTSSATSTNATTTNTTSTDFGAKKGIREKIYGNYLESIIKSLIRQSQNLKDRIVKSEYVNDVLETSIVKEIETDIAKLNEFLTKIKSATKNEELKDIRNKLQTYKKDVLQIRIRKVLAIINVTKFTQNYLVKIEEKLKTAETNLGATATKEQKDLIASAKTKIEEVKKALTDLLTSINSKPLAEFNKVDINKELRTLQTKINEIKKSIAGLSTQVKEKIKEESKEQKGKNDDNQGKGKK